MIPYPLSTGQHCGDSMYSRFQCNISTGQLTFKAPGSSYRVTRINQDARKFYIQTKDDEYNCETETRKSRSTIFQLNQLWPFRVTNWCVNDTNNISFVPSKSRKEIEIGWESPPKPPTCNSSADCRSWPHSSCNATDEGIGRCLCHMNFNWDGSKLNCTQGSDIFLTCMSFVLGSEKRSVAQVTQNL